MSKSVYKKLLEVRKAVPYLQKGNKGHQYNYVGSSDVLGALRNKMDEVGLLLFPKVLDSKVTTSSVTNQDKYGNKKTTHTFFTELKMEFLWVCAETGEEISVPFYAQGIDVQGEKGVGKALTYAEKYFLLKQFNIATDNDDPDSFQQKIDQALPNFIDKNQVNELNSLLQQISQITGTPIENYMDYLQIKSFDRLKSEHFLNVRVKLTNWLTSAKNNQKNQQNQTPNQLNAPKSVLSNEQVAELNKIVSDIANLRNVEPQTIVAAISAGRTLNELTIDEFDSTKAKLNKWLEAASQNSEEQTGPTQHQEKQSIQPTETSPMVNGKEYVLSKIEVGKSPNGVEFAKVFVEGSDSPLFVKDPNVKAILQNLQEGQTFIAEEVMENGFVFITSMMKKTA